jgi:hypothetical protein
MEDPDVSVAPSKLSELQTFLKDKTGLTAVSIGIVGNSKHKSGYHLGRDRIFKHGGQGENDYSVKTDRDVAGLSDAASAMDIGSFNGFRRMSKFIVGEARADAPDTRDIREIIFSPDGKKILRWDRERGVASKPKEGEADDSHLTHTHVSWYRDSQHDDKTGVFRRFFDGGPPTEMKKGSKKQPVKPKEEVVKSFAIPLAPAIATLPKGTRLFEASDLKKVAFNIDPGRDMPFLGEPFKGVALIHRTNENGTPSGKAFFAKMSDLKDIRPA